MAIPDVIWIAREPGYHTATIGRYREGQFYAAIHGAHSDDDKEPDLHRERIRWYAYLHLFDSAGYHQRSDVRLAGTGPYLRGELRQRAAAQLTALLGQLDGLHLDDIQVRLFHEQHDGVTFGLVDESDAERGDRAELHPGRLGFSRPGDGTYST
jgi:hypothetical protein